MLLSSACPCMSHWCHTGTPTLHWEQLLLSPSTEPIDLIRNDSIIPGAVVWSRASDSLSSHAKEEGSWQGEETCTESRFIHCISITHRCQLEKISGWSCVTISRKIFGFNCNCYIRISWKNTFNVVIFVFHKSWQKSCPSTTWQHTSMAQIPLKVQYVRGDNIYYFYAFLGDDCLTFCAFICSCVFI